jgi:hypothetical protein
MEVVNADQVKPAYQAIRRILDCLRLLWLITGGLRVDGPLVISHEEIYKCLLARAAGIACEVLV